MSKRILVIDDEKNIRFMIAQCLEQEGYVVELAVDGEHGLEKSAVSEYDLVLLDIKLPGMDGVEVLHQMREIHIELPVIMITAHGTIETAVETMKLGAVDYLQKPFTPDEIIAVVERVMARQNLSLKNVASSFENCLEQAKLLIQKRNYDQAKSFLLIALNKDTLRPEPYNLLGCISELQGNESEARRLYRAAISVDPTYMAASANLHRLTEMFPTRREAPEIGQPKGEM